MRIYCQDIGMEFGTEKCTLLVMKSGKRHMTVGVELPNQEKSELSEKRKPNNTWEYWKLIPSNKWKGKKNFKSVSQKNKKTTQDKTL